MIDRSELSLHEKAAQLLFPRLGSNMPPPVRAAEDLERFADMHETCPVGGLIVFNGRYPDTTEALVDLQRRSRVPLLVSADMERGVGQQVQGATMFPHAMAYSAIDEGAEQLLEASARIQAREALGSGIHITFSPAADVNRDRRNPIIATRAFSDQPDVAARLTQAFIRGARLEGVLTTAKHFPGHGNTSKDSHSEMPVVDSPRSDLDAFDLVPFRAAIKAGVDLVMSAHLVYPALDPDRPATLSSAILRDLLRGELGFEGVVATDSLLMGAIRKSHETPGQQAAALVEAGVDIQLDVPDPVAAAEGIVRAVESGRLDEALVDDAVDRILTLKRRMMDRFGGAFFTSPTSVIRASEIGSEENTALARRVARAAVRIVDGAEQVPLNVDGAQEGSLVALLIKPHKTRLDPEEEPFGNALRSALPRADFRQIDPGQAAGVRRSVMEAVGKAAHVVVAVVVKPAAWHAFGLEADQDELLREIIALKPSILASLGSPYVLDDYEEAAARICAYSDVRASQEALVDVLVGQ